MANKKEEFGNCFLCSLDLHSIVEWFIYVLFCTGPILFVLKILKKKNFMADDFS